MSTPIAFSIPEILEGILLHLDMETLLLAQRTCRTWRAVIQSSPALEKALYMAPAHSFLADDAQKREMTCNPLLARKFPQLFPTIRDSNKPKVRRERNTTIFTGLHMLEPNKLESYIRPEASWRRMLVQEPPVKTIAVFTATYGWATSYSIYEIEAGAKGLTMGAYFEYMIFNDGLWWLPWATPWVVWWEETTKPRPWDTLKQLGGPTLAAEIVIIKPGISSCIDEKDDNEDAEHVRLRNRIRDTYATLGVEPCPLRNHERVNVWSYSKMN
ncbi:hypothetical protein BDW74DRAFT_66850 [Aspergillus multicolor]|uniref:F-box protein n=1 Tax=Aspergillus multicolor TaxID=41759 RepID=UPI003CCCCDA5